MPSTYAYDTWGAELEKLDRFGVPYQDEIAWVKHSGHTWVYDKLELYKRQGVRAVPHGVEFSFPCFSKPICNLFGLSAGVEIFNSEEEFVYKPGHLLMPIYGGPHFSVDTVVMGGEVLWLKTVRGYPGPTLGSFSSWRPVELPKIIDQTITGFVDKYLSGYTGVLNFEAKWDNNKVVLLEVHLRMAAQFLDFYPTDWLEKVTQLYVNRKWEGPTGKMRDGIIEVVELPKAYAYHTPSLSDPFFLKELEEEVYSIYLPWYDGEPFIKVRDPEHNYRLACIAGPENDRTYQVANAISKCITIGEPNGRR